MQSGPPINGAQSQRPTSALHVPCVVQSAWQPFDGATAISGGDAAGGGGGGGEAFGGGGGGDGEAVAAATRPRPLLLLPRADSPLMASSAVRKCACTRSISAARLCSSWFAPSRGCDPPFAE